VYGNAYHEKDDVSIFSRIKRFFKRI
jgi:hypothetical protein